MERVSNKRLDNFPAATLFLEDVREIVQSFAATCRSVEVQAGEYKITDPSEFDALAAKFEGEPFPPIYIRGSQPYVTFDLHPVGASAYISEDSVEQRGLVARLQEIVERRKRLRTDNVLAVACGLVFSIGVALVASKDLAIWGIPLVACSWLAFPLALRLRKRILVAHSRHRREVIGFFQRKKDDLALAGISAVIGAAAGYLASKLG